jgi:hypothetical protein
MRITKITFLAVFVFIWLAALNNDLFKLASKLDFVRDGYQYGDLYRLTNLPQFKDPKKACSDYQAPAVPGNNKKINLFIVGDSFTEPGRISKENFPVSTFHYLHQGEILHLKADTNAFNILIIECVERHFRGNFAGGFKNVRPDSATFISKLSNPTFMQDLDMAFAAKSKEDRLEMLLFQNNLILTIKEWKAAFNQKVFGRVSDIAKLVNDDTEIVYYMDVDTPAKTSSFTLLSNGEIDTLVNNMMDARKLAMRAGIDEIILSIVPNKISVVMPEYAVYNKLIERMYAHPDLKIPVIDVLSDFQLMKSRAYLNGDSHWTCEAQQIWLQKANNAIQNIVLSRNDRITSSSGLLNSSVGIPIVTP